MNKFRYVGLVAALSLLSYGVEAAQEVTGTVVPVAVETVDFGSDAGFLGWTEYVARYGEIIKPNVRDANHKIVDPGTILCSMRYKPWLEAVKAADAASMTSEQVLKLAKDNYVRYKKLAEARASSQESLTDQESNYAVALGQYESNVAVEIMQKDVLDSMTTRAPFEGFVSKVLFEQGNATGRPPTLEITQLNPIAIQIKLPREQMKAINASTPISVYIVGQDKPVGVFGGFSYLSSDSLYLTTENYPIHNGKRLETDGKKVLRNWISVLNFDVASSSSDTIAVANSALQSDEKGTFVWRAKGQKLLQLGKGVDTEFQIEKVYVKPSGLFRLRNGSIKLAQLADKGSLELYQMVLLDPPPGLTDGQTVLSPEPQYMLMPGDQVRVVIGSGPIEKKVN